MSTAATKRPTPRLPIAVKGLKVTTLLSAASIPPDLVPPEPQPAGEVRIDLDVGGKLAVSAMVNGKAVRKALKAIAEHGPDAVTLFLQGQLCAGVEPGTFVLDCAGLTAQPKTPPAAKAEAP
jgi:hypothetical protein